MSDDEAALFVVASAIAMGLSDTTLIRALAEIEVAIECPDSRPGLIRITETERLPAVHVALNDEVTRRWGTDGTSRLNARLLELQAGPLDFLWITREHPESVVAVLAGVTA